LVKTAALLALGILVGVLVMTWLPDRASQPGDADDEDKPLYWVAPMDPEYRRDGPGKSPMGMDLVPVYADDARASGGSGTVEISPEVINNLGVRTASVSRQPLQPRIRTVGYVQYNEDRLIHIHPRVEGWIERLHVKAAGDPVERGQPLYALYSPQLVNAQEELLLALKRNNELLQKAARDRLLALQMTSEFIDQLERDRKVRQTITFLSPQSGVIDNLNIREGFYVLPGTTLMSVGALDDVWVEAEVFEREASRVRVGQAVTMRLDYLPGRRWQGRVDYIYPSLDEKTRTLRIRLRFANEQRELKPNMFAQIEIDTSEDADTLVVPREAIIRTGSQDRVVLALGEGRFKSIAVSLGRMDERSVEVLDGLKEGDEVVVSAQFLLDSESSKTSDFLRMHHEPAGDDAMDHQHHHHLGGESS
jgi:Cu(I)/Ag(I) efflux system membrane fusion protein